MNPIACKAAFLQLLLLFIVQSIYASNPADSLINLANKKTGTAQLDLLLEATKSLSYSEFERSIKTGEKCIELAKTLNNEKAEAKAYSHIGDAYYYAYSFELAKKNYRKSLQIAQSEDLEEETANAFNNLGIIYYMHYEFTPALQYFSKAEKIYTNIDDKEGLGNVLNNIGNIYLEKGNFDSANTFYQKALNLKRNAGNLKDLSKALNNIGNVFENKGEHKQALFYYKEALETIKQSGDKKGAAMAYLSIGIIHQNYSEYQKSMVNFRHALTLFKETQDAGGIAKSHNNIGLNHYHIGNYEDALNNYQTALSIQETIGDKQGIATSLYNIATIFDILNQFEKALQYYEKSLQLKNDLNDKNGIANVYNSIGNTHANLGDYDKALDFYNKSLQIKLQSEDKEGIAMLYQNVGALMEMSGNDREAIDYYKKSLAIEEDLSNSEGIAHSLQSMGTIYKNAGDFEKAKSLYIQVQDIAKKHNFKKILMNNNKYLSEIAMLTDRFQAALDYYIDYTAIKDTLFNEKSQRQISDIQTKYETEKNQQEIELQKKDLVLKDTELQKRRLWIYSLLSGIIVAFFVLFLVYSRYLIKNKANKLLAERHAEIEAQQKEIMASIQYASKIQSALLPPTEYIESLLPNCFILNRPRDVVSGDFYWISEQDSRFFVAAADCTGHGVPGAFMSMLGLSYLNDTVSHSSKQNTGEILNEVRAQIIHNLHQKNEVNEIKDGMDIALFSVDKATKKLEYSGAHNPLYIIRDNELIELKPDNMPIAIYYKMQDFNTHTFQLQTDDLVYSFSDGYIDQFGGPKGKKFMKTRFKKLLLEVANLPILDQKEVLNKTIDEWMGQHEQIDDILVIGLKIE